MEKETRLAIAYLSRHVDEQPDESKSIFEKLMMYDQQASNIDAALKDAYTAIEKLNKEFQKTIGAIEALVGVAEKFIDKNKQKEWAAKYVSETKNINPPPDSPQELLNEKG
jgi:predicted negative regulator of RcsB-dependent stress response